MYMTANKICVSDEMEGWSSLRHRYQYFSFYLIILLFLMDFIHVAIRYHHNIHTLIFYLHFL